MTLPSLILRIFSFGKGMSELRIIFKVVPNGGWEFSERFLNKYSGEDEYIMKIDFSFMYLLKYVDHNY